jgi:hypothetical protein
VTDSAGHRSIDHLAHTRDPTTRVPSELPRRAADGLHLSDHFGLVLEVCLLSNAPHYNQLGPETQVRLA